MSAALFVVAMIAAVDPARFRAGLPDGLGLREVAGGGAVAAAVLVGLAAAADWLLELLVITPETFRMAAGLVLVLAAVWNVVTGSRKVEPLAPGRWSALWPVAFPGLITPAAVGLAITAGASGPHQVVSVLTSVRTEVSLLIVAVGVAVACALAVVTWRSSLSRAGWVAVSRLLSVPLVVVGMVLIVEGIRDV